MVFNNLPPQAYTRDTLALAYEWLSTQPMSVREIANNADTLVALYLQSRRRVGGAPVSKDNLQPARQVGTANHTQVENAIKSQTSYESEGFKSDLKALAENMRQFENPKTTSSPSSAPLNRVAPERIEERIIEEVIRKTALEKSIRETTQVNQVANHATHMTTPISSTTSPMVQPTPTPTTATHSHSAMLALDPRSSDILRETCARLNLGSEQEAMRMLLVLGSERLHSLLTQK